MRNRQKSIFSIIICIVALCAMNACKKAKVSTGTDSELYAMAKETSGFTWYKNTSSLLNKSSASGHSQPFLRTRYNAIASGKLDSNGKLVNGTIFPDGSLIVKELYDNSSILGRYAILYKKTGSPNADANGWVWGYINSDGTVAFEASKKGSSCTTCHSQTNSIDYMLMSKFFP